MGKHGTGSVRQLRSGRWQARLPGGSHLGVYEDETTARTTLAVAIDMLATGQAHRADAVTLRTWGARWLEQRELKGTRAIVTDRRRWDRHVLAAPFVDEPLPNVQPIDVYRWIDQLGRTRAADRYPAPGAAPRRLSRQTIKHCINLLRVALDGAVREGLITENPARDVRLERDKGRTQDPWTYLLPPEQDALLACPDASEAERDVVAFALGTGLRQSEQWSLLLRDVHIEGPDPHVVVRFGKNGQPPKNGKIRRVPLFGIALEAARRWVARLPSFCPGNPLGLAFPTARGCRRCDGKPPRSWRAHLAAAGLGDPAARHDGRPVRWHDLRHSCASSLVAGWWGRRWSLEEVRELLGHSSITVTQRYAHLGETALRVAARGTTGGGSAGHGLGTVATASSRILNDFAGTPGRIRTCDPRLRR
ncbi:MAG: tyrosine-type recombinase/integrase, partial [Polyangiaceae bacterium]|nr:tyrosine-type recombinase/integrase [Polyangiaceae bacterium]